MMAMEKYKHRVQVNSGLWDAYKDFRKTYKLIHPEVDRRKYVEICHMINIRLSDKIIKESLEFRMPHRLGMISVKKDKLEIRVKDGKLLKGKMVIDWAKSWELWNSEFPGKTRKEINAIKGKLAIYTMNEHTNGYVMRWKWDKSTCNVDNQSVYWFRPTKRNRLALASWINSEERVNDYYLIKKYNGSKKRKRLTEGQERVQEVGKV